MFERDYAVLGHGWLCPSRCEVSGRIMWSEGDSSASHIHQRGKPSCTQMRVLAHANHGLSLMTIRIVTGRRHQIRLHTAHVGHPVVFDQKYTAASTVVADSAFGERNFLHRYRLGFEDTSGHAHEAVAPLPPDLTAVLLHIQPRNLASMQALSIWAGSGVPSAWSMCVSLV